MSGGGLLLALLAAAVKAGILLALAAGLARLLRQAPARARHGIWAGALAGALLLPMLSPWLPAWSIAALPAPALATGPLRWLAEPTELQSADRLGAAVEPGAAARAAAAGDAAPALRGADEEVGDAATSLAPAEAPARPVSRGSSTGLASTGLASTGLASTGLASSGLTSIAAASAPPARGWQTAASPAAWLLGIWLAGCLASAAGLLRSVLAARRLERGAAAPSAPWLEALAEARRRVGVRRRVRLLHSPAVATPMTWGLLRPVILLPAAAAGWSAERRRIVLLHELVHVRRADWLVRLLGRLVCSLYWPNPLAWAAARRLAAEQEMACDEEVVALGTRPSSYAGHLLAIARSLAPGAAAGARTPAHALDMARRSQMEGRLMSILDGNRSTTGGRKLSILTLLILAGLVPALAAVEPWVAEQQPPASSSASDSLATSNPDGDTEGVARVLGEIEALERRMEPFEAELEAVELEMQPIERELEGIEVAIEPVEAELEGLETELEPYEAGLEAIEAEMEPHQARLESIAAEIEPFEAALEAVAAELEPFEERLEEIQGASEMPDERLAEILRQMEPLHERLGGIHQQMEPFFERMAAVHEELEPLHERLAQIHQEMEPVHERVSAAYERMTPIHDRLGEHHQRLEPHHRKIGEIHERMQPLHEEMGRRHEELERELEGLVERLLARQLAGVTAPDTDYAPAAARIADEVSLRVYDGTLRVLSSAPRLREILAETLAGRGAGSADELSAAIDRAVRAIGELEIAAR